MKRGLKIAFVLVALIISAAHLFSPYDLNKSNQRYEVNSTITIHTPVHAVYDYLGNSDNAAKWSSYVDHITVINNIPDGNIGSIRRCYKNQDENGIVWDEEILEVEPHHLRKLSIFNGKGFPIYAKNLRTEQLYEALDSNQCKLTFNVYFEGNPSLIEKYKMYFGAYIMQGILDDNLENIKSIMEKD